MAFNRRIGYVIGIDPDLIKSGVACIERNHRALDVAYLNFPETLEWVKAKYAEWEGKYKETAPNSFMVYVEAGWLNKGNWHVTESRNGHFSPSAWAAAVGKSDGECSAISKKLIECFEYYGIPVTPMKPLRKCWKGRDRKITHDEIKQFTHIQQKRTNQEERDALLLAWVEAGLPIRVKSS